MDGVQLPQGQSHFEEAVHFLPLKFPEIPGTHFIDLGRMKGWVDLEATHWFRMRDLWIGNPAKDTSSAQQWNKNVTKYSFESNNKIF